jgi:cytochrome c553
MLAVALVAGLAGEAGADERVERLVQGKCANCHGRFGEAASELSPRLAAQNAAYIAKQLGNFLSGERKSSVMSRMGRGLSAQDIRGLAAYYAAQPPIAVPANDEALVGRGRTIFQRGGSSPEVKPCVRCHGERGHGGESLARLAGQIPGYLIAQLRQFAQGERGSDSEMQTIAARMSADEMAAVAAYLSTLD